MKKKYVGWRNSFNIRGPVCDHDQFEDWESEESRLRSEKFNREMENAKQIPTHRINAIANSHDYSCRCGFCMEYLHRTCNGF